MGWKSADWIVLAQGRDKLRAAMNAVMSRNSWLAEELLDSGEELGFLDLAVLTRQEWCVWWNVGVHCYTDRMSRGLHTLMLHAMIPPTDWGTVTGCQLTWTEDCLCVRQFGESDWRHIRSGICPFHTLQWTVCSLYCTFPKYSYLQSVSVNMLCAFLSSSHELRISRPLQILALRPVPNVALLPILSVYLISYCIMCRGDL
jgi:hypothetical protein